MPVTTVRPNTSIQTGSWTIVGGGGVLHTALSDNSDASYIQNAARCRLPTQLAKVGIADVSLPTGAKIFSVRVRIRTERITGVTIQPQCILVLIQKIIELAFTVNITRIFQFIFGFFAPRSTTAGWTTTDLAYYTEQPAGGEWTQASFNAFEVNLGRESVGGNLRVAEVYVDVDYNERPVVAATAPTGSVTTTTRPTVTWTYTDPEQDRQQAYQVRVFTAAQYGAAGFDPAVSKATCESGWLKGEDLSWTVDPDIVNGSYRAYVQAEQVWGGVGQHVSVMSFAAWTQAVPGPGVPLLTATYEEPLNRVRLDLDDGPAPATETYDVQYSDDAGLNWSFVRAARQVVAPGGGAITLYDYAAPLNRVRQYRVQAFRTLGSVKVGSDFSVVASATPRSSRFWLKDPLAPTLNMVLPLGNDEFAAPRSEGVFKPLVADGRAARAVVVSGPVYGREGSWELLFPGQQGGTAWAAFAAIRESGRVLLWQLPTGDQYYVSLTGDLSTTWGLRGPVTRWRRAKIDYTEVVAPPD